MDDFRNPLSVTAAVGRPAICCKGTHGASPVMAGTPPYDSTNGAIVSADEPQGHDPRHEEWYAQAKANAELMTDKTGARWEPLTLPMGWGVGLAGFEDPLLP